MVKKNLFFIMLFLTFFIFPTNVYAWLDGWDKCKNIYINVTGSNTNFPVYMNITGITFNTTYEGRLNKAPCNNGVSIQDHQVISNTTNSHYIVWLYNETDGNTTWSYFYNNSDAPNPNYDTIVLFYDSFDEVVCPAWADKWNSSDTAKYSCSDGKLIASEIDGVEYDTDTIRTEDAFTIGNMTIWVHIQDNSESTRFYSNRYLFGVVTQGTWTNDYNLLSNTDNPDEFRVVVDFPTEDYDSDVDIPLNESIGVKLFYDGDSDNAFLWVYNKTDDIFFNHNTTNPTSNIAYWGLWHDSINAGKLWVYEFIIYNSSFGNVEDALINPRITGLPTLTLGSEETECKNISICSILNAPNCIYNLTANIVNSSASSCMNISANNVTLDCQGYNIDGIDNFGVLGSPITFGIKIPYPSSYTNTTLMNCNVTDWDVGIYLGTGGNTYFNVSNCTTNSNNEAGVEIYRSNYNHISLVNAENNNYYGIYIYKGWYNNISDSFLRNNSNGYFEYLSSYNNLTNITSIENNDYGLRFNDQADGRAIVKNSLISNNVNGGVYVYVAGDKPNSFFNNLFNNTNNVVFHDTNPNIWNTTQQSGIRIYSSGTEIGGNYWTNSTNNGYSDICSCNSNGFCENPYNLTINNMDYLPLCEYILPDPIVAPIVICFETKPICVKLSDNTIYYFDTVNTQGNMHVSLNLPVSYPYIFAHTNNTMAVGSAGTWYNVTFDRTDYDGSKITHTYNDATNTTFTITETGIYDIHYNLDFEDSAITPDSNVVYRVVNNDVEIVGSVREIDLDKKDWDRICAGNVLVSLSEGDKIKLQFTSDDTTVTLETDCTYGDHCDSATISITRIA